VVKRRVVPTIGHHKSKIDAPAGWPAAGRREPAAAPAGRRPAGGRVIGPKGDARVAPSGHDDAMHVLWLPFRWAYRGLVWLANSPRTLILSYLLLIVLCALLYDQFEGEVTFGDAIWWAVVTASTVGYGDISPDTWQARVIAAILISVMVLLVIPLITAHFASKLIVDTDAFRHEEQEELKQNLRRVRVLLEALAEREGVSVPDSADRTEATSDR
jgi:voltage-gated potassium channel